jgi:hypothetical protein
VPRIEMLHDEDSRSVAINRGHDLQERGQASSRSSNRD